MRTRIDCCNGCVAPKRYPGCHASCPEYKAERAELDADNAVRKAKYLTAAGIEGQKQDGIHKRTKKRRLP